MCTVDETTEDLRKMLQNKLDDKVLDIISVMLDRNPKCKLNFEDVRVSITLLEFLILSLFSVC